MPNKRLFLFGYSMGGAIVAKWAITRQVPLGGLVLVSPAVRIGRGLFPMLRQLAWLISRLMPRLRIVKIGSRFLSRNQAVVEEFNKDPLVFHGRFPVRTGAEILATMEFLTDHMESLRAPLLILHGTGDHICDPDGSRQLGHRAGSRDKTLRLYEGLYHELFSEPERDVVLADFLAWLAGRAGAPVRV